MFNLMLNSMLTSEGRNTHCIQTAAYLMVLMAFSPMLSYAQDDCNEALVLRYENASEYGEDYFSLYVDFESDANCDIGGYAVTVEGEPVMLSTFDTGGYMVGINENAVEFMGNFTPGTSNYLGVLRISGPSSSYVLQTAYFDNALGTWESSDQEVETFCTIENGTICGRKFEDSNCDGIQDPWEPGIEGWTIKIVNKANNTTLTTVTDVAGNYKFTNLSLAPWYIYETQIPGWAQTYPAKGHHYVVLPSAQTPEYFDFGNVKVCEEPQEIVYLAGAKDDFGPGIDDLAAKPSADLLNYLQGKTIAGFDDEVNNKHFAHSFTDYILDDCCIVGATLAIHLKTNSPSVSKNDGIGFVQDGQRSYYNSIGELLDITWKEQGGTMLVLDLGDLPETAHGKSVLSTLRDGTFDFFIQDDSNIDWAELTIEYCCPPECCEYLTPFYSNTTNGGDCCFDLGVFVENDFECEYEAVRMTVLEDGTSISYAGNGSLNYTINGNQITVTQPVIIGPNNLGTFCFSGGETSYHVLFEYWDNVSGEWVDCNQILTVECLIEEGNLCGSKFEDSNCNGVRDIGEPGIPNWTITIRNKANKSTRTVQTDADGNYCFYGLEFATWCVYEEQQFGWTQTFPDEGSYRVVLSSNTTIDNLTFGNAPYCSFPQVTSYLAGSMDDFGAAPDVPAASPSSELVNFLQGSSPIVGFDYIGINRHFAHTFTEFSQLIDDGCCIIDAELVLRVQTNPLENSWNDNLVFVQNGKIIYSRRIGDFAGVKWENQPPTIIRVDLNDLVPGRTSSILPSLMDGSLDFFIQDDTSVDWAQLNMYYCCEEPPQVTPVHEELNIRSTMLSPNPVTDQLSFDFSLQQAGTLEIEVVNSLGQQVARLDARLYDAGAHSLSFDLQNVNQGAYFVRVRSKSGWSKTLPFSIVR